MAGVTPSTIGKYVDVSSLWTGSAYMVTCDQHTTNRVGWYVDSEITKLPMLLGNTFVHGQHTTNGDGWYAGMKITKLPMMLDHTLAHGQHTTDEVGWYIEMEITKSPMVLDYTLMHGNVPPMPLGDTSQRQR